MSLEKWSWVASIIGGIIALIGLPFVAIQLASARRQQRDAIRLSQAQVLFAADSVIAAYKDVAAKLRPGGEWTEELSHVHPTNAELHLVEPYLGIFERIFLAYREGQITEDALDDFFGYRLINIWDNHRIVNCLLQNPDQRDDWKNFVALTWVLEAHWHHRLRFHTDQWFPEEQLTRIPKKAQQIKETLKLHLLP
jgi:hypothetical protein